MPDTPPIEFAFPDLRKWEKGAAPYIHVLESGKPGPTVAERFVVRGGGAGKRGGERGGPLFCARVFAADRFFFSLKKRPD